MPRIGRNCEENRLGIFGDKRSGGKQVVTANGDKRYFVR